MDTDNPNVLHADEINSALTQAMAKLSGDSMSTDEIARVFAAEGLCYDCICAALLTQGVTPPTTGYVAIGMLTAAIAANTYGTLEADQ